MNDKLVIMRNGCCGFMRIGCKDFPYKCEDCEHYKLYPEPTSFFKSKKHKVIYKDGTVRDIKRVGKKLPKVDVL